MFYKAKQDAIDALTKEMLKSIDEINMKMENLATKAELEDLRVLIGSSQTTVAAPVEEEPKTVPADKTTELESQKQEIEDFLRILEEQHKNREISDDDYQRAKKTNMEKLREIENKISEKSVKSELPENVTEKSEPHLTDKKKEKKPKELESEKSVEDKEYEEDSDEREHESRLSKRERMLLELEESFRKGLITRKTYERTRKILMR